MRSIDVVITRDICCPSFGTSLCGVLSISHRLICFWFAIFPYDTHIYIIPFCFAVDIYDNGAIKDAHSSYKPTRKRKPIIVCGDFNVAATPLDIKNPKANEHNAGYTIQEREAFKNMLGSGFVDSFRYLHPDEKDAYSWWSYRFNARAKNIGWRLDYFLVSDFEKDKIIGAKIHSDIMGSDHCPISLEFDV